MQPEPGKYPRDYEIRTSGSPQSLQRRCQGLHSQCVGRTLYYDWDAVHHMTELVWPGPELLPSPTGSRRVLQFLFLVCFMISKPAR